MVVSIQLDYLTFLTKKGEIFATLKKLFLYIFFVPVLLKQSE